MIIIAWMGIVELPLRYELSAGLFLTNYRHIFLSNYSFSETWWLGHSWSLCVEEQFYLLWPLTILLLGISRCYWLALGVITVSPFVRISCYFLFPDWRGAIGMTLPTRADQLMFGCAAALSYRSAKFQAVLDRLFRYKAHWAAAIFIFCASPLLEQRFRGVYMLPCGWSLDGLGILIFLLWAVRHPQGRLGVILNSRPAVFLGVLSYSLYLWQQPFLTYLNKTFSGAVPWNILCSFMAAAFSYFVVEHTFLRWRDRICVGGAPPSKAPSLSAETMPIVSEEALAVQPSQMLT